MNTFYIVAGALEQRSLRLPAAQLYASPLFSACITHARRFAKEEGAVRILSPKFGLLSQSRLIEPYHLTFDDLNSNARAELIPNIRAELPRRGMLPLRVVVLAPDEVVELFRVACLTTRFENVPLRSPLSNLPHEQQIPWLQSATWPIECDVQLPSSGLLSAFENERLKDAVSAASIWWSEQLIKNAPPPEPTLFANALALQLGKTWEQVASATRGEWPEDIRFPIDFQDATGPIYASLTALGFEPRDWWKREGTRRPPQLSMQFSISQVTVVANGVQHVIFR